MHLISKSWHPIAIVGQSESFRLLKVGLLYHGAERVYVVYIRQPPKLADPVFTESILTNHSNVSVGGFVSRPFIIDKNEIMST